MEKPKLKEWWLKCALGEEECKLEAQGTPSQEIINFYGGRLYQKEVEVPTNHYEWVPIKLESEDEYNVACEDCGRIDGIDGTDGRCMYCGATDQI